jgi:predicted small secreted protein
LSAERQPHHGGNFEPLLSLSPTSPETKQPEVIIMRKSSPKLTLTLLVLLGAAPLLGACHTVAGAGEDVSKTGTVIEKTADKAVP